MIEMLVGAAISFVGVILGVAITIAASGTSNDEE
jgi:hypothetical protein